MALSSDSAPLDWQWADYRLGLRVRGPLPLLGFRDIDSRETIKMGSTIAQESSSKATITRRGVKATKSRCGTGNDRPSAKPMNILVIFAMPRLS